MLGADHPVIYYSIFAVRTIVRCNTILKQGGHCYETKKAHLLHTTPVKHLDNKKTLSKHSVLIECFELSTFRISNIRLKSFQSRENFRA